MSSFLLPVALLSTFGAVALLTVGVAYSKAQRKQALKVLEAQVGPASMNLREQEMDASLMDRGIIPLASRFAGLALKLTPMDSRDRIAKKLTLAGSPAGWDAEKIMGIKLVGMVVMVALGLMITSGMQGPPILPIAVLGLCFALGYFGPNALLDHKAEARQEEMRKTLPDTMDLLTISVEAGLGFDAAMVQVVQNVPGALSHEFSRMLQEMRLGIARVEAFRHLAKRTNIEELSSFILAMIQADTFGVSISKVLRAQAKELRTKRRQRAEEKAMRVPIKILFPLIFCILPALFVVVLGPGAIRIAENLFGITS